MKSMMLPIALIFAMMATMEMVSLGRWSAGLGVCNPADRVNCGDPNHQVDNVGPDDWVLFTFTTPIGPTSITVDPINIQNSGPVNAILFSTYEGEFSGAEIDRFKIACTGAGSRTRHPALAGFGVVGAASKENRDTDSGLIAEAVTRKELLRRTTSLARGRHSVHQG